MASSTPVTAKHALAMLLALGLNSAAMAAETGKSLSEQRNGIFQGTSRGILLFGGDSAKPAAPASGAKATVTPSASSGPSTSAGAQTRTPPGVDTSAQERSPVFSTPSLSKLSPPSGIPLNAVRHQVGPERGVALPVAKPASDAKP